MSGLTRARVAAVTDLETVTETITLAFAEDPLWGPAMAQVRDLHGHRAELWRGYLTGAMRYPWMWLTEGGGAVSVWIPPGGTEMSAEQEERWLDLIRERLGPGADDFLDTLDRFAAAHPHDEPHYYLSLLGTHPEYRGRGLGMALLADNLSRVDAEGVPAYLESTNPGNDHRYASVGFEPFGSFATPYGGHVVNTMWRPARVP